MQEGHAAPLQDAGNAGVTIRRAGRVAYLEGLALQRETAERRLAGEIGDTLLLCEHEPVYTRGRRASDAELPMGAEWYERQGIEVCETDRGGQVTYHGPGQLIAYPIIDLSARSDDVHRYVRELEAVMIASLKRLGVSAGTIEGLTGVWTGEAALLGGEAGLPGVQAAVGEGRLRKIGSIGVHVSQGVTTHGFSLNLDCDLQPFQWIVPCGIEGCRATSVLAETGAAPGMETALAACEAEFLEIFGPSAEYPRSAQVGG